jgi:hypothetical protein
LSKKNLRPLFSLLRLLPLADEMTHEKTDYYRG